MPAPRLDSSVIDRLFERSSAAHWDVPRERFEAAIYRSLNHAFGAINPTTSEVSEYLDDLHVEDLALAVACEDGSQRAWEHFMSEYQPALRRAADAIDPTGSARDIADSIHADLYGLTERDGARRSLLRYFHGRSRLATWLRAVLSQRWIDRVRSGRRTEALPEDAERLPGSANSTGANVLQDRYRASIQEALANAIARLPARDRLRLSLYYAQGLKLAAIGKMLREHEATVSRQLAKTRDGLAGAVRASLKHDHGMDDRTVEESLQAVMDDTGSMDVNQLIGVGTRKKSPPDRSKE
jgi:RNA polymerase sigma-70 factor (ECF subfamily)